MTYVSYRASGTVSAASGATAAVTGDSLTPDSLLLVAVATSATAKNVSSIATATGTGTFAYVTAVNYSTSLRVELWTGRAFTGYPTGLTVTFSQSTGNHAVRTLVLDTSAGLSSAPTVTPNAGSTGTSVSVDTGTVAPSIGDLAVAVGAWANGTASSARTPTGNTFLENTETAYSTALRVGISWAQATAAVDTRLVWTITSANWAAAAATIVLPADAAAVTGLLLKGRLTAAADQAATT